MISVDVVHDSDEDTFQLSVLHLAALGLSLQCVEGSSHVGGKIFVGPQKLVYVLVFGRIAPPPVSKDGSLVRPVPSITRNQSLEVA